MRRTVLRRFPDSGAERGLRWLLLLLLIVIVTLSVGGRLEFLP